MRKLRLRAIVLVLLIVVVFSAFSGCDNEQKKADFQLKVVANTAKIMRTDTKYESELTYIQVDGAKGEIEGGKFLILPNSDIKSFDVTMTPLIASSGKTIPTENIEILVERYINVSVKSNNDQSLELGYYPDAIIPIDKYKAKNENKIASDNNQGILINIDIPLNAEAGDYTSTVTANCDETVKTIVFNLHVFDFVISQETHMNTAMFIRREWLMNGELDDSEAMYRAYVDFAAKNRIANMYLPVWDLADPLLVKYIAEVKAVTQNPRVASFNLPDKYSINSTDTTVDNMNVAITNFYDYDWAFMKNLLTELAKNSTEAVNLLNKAYFYPTQIDEPQFTNVWWQVNWFNKKFRLVKQEVADLLVSDGTIAVNSNIYNSIIGIPLVSTASIDSRIEAEQDTWCPSVDNFDSEEMRVLYQKELDAGKGTWWYTCITPENPYPTSHIDDYLIGMRTLQWMAMDYDIDGWLYWSFNQYSQNDGINSGYVVRDPYEDSLSFVSHPGDGFLTYPGVNYDIYGPVSSLRIEVIRDGLEDYEYLWYLKELIEGDNGINASYGMSENFNQTMQDTYATLYEGVRAKNDDVALKQARRKIAAMIENYSNPAKPYLKIGTIDPKLETAQVEFYANSGTTAKINSVSITPTPIIVGGIEKGLMFTHDIALSSAANYVDVEFVYNNITYTQRMFASNRVKLISDFELESSLSKITKIDSEIMIENQALNVTIANPINQSVSLRQGILLARDKYFASIKMTEVAALRLTLSNLSSSDITIKVGVKEGSSYYTYGSANVTANAVDYSFDVKLGDQLQGVDVDSIAIFVYNNSTGIEQQLSIKSVVFLFGGV